MIQGWIKQLYFWVLVGIIIGGIIGATHPAVGVSLKPLGDGFISLIKMLIGPVIFCTVVLGIASAGDMKKVSRVGFKSIIYFEFVSTFALVIGLIVANGLRPGAGIHVDVSQLTGTEVSEYARRAGEQSSVDFILHIIPKTFFDAFSGSGDLLQIILIAILFGYSMNQLGKKGEAIHRAIESASHIFFGIVQTIMKLAPLGAGGAMAFTVGKYGVKSLLPLAYLMMCFYLTCFLFVGLVLGVIARLTGFSILRFIKYIREELLLVLGTSSSESALVPLMVKLERLGCPRAVVGLVVPAGYSFNLDGTNIYLTLAALFIAQAMGVELSLMDQFKLLGVAMLTSKGASGVTGAGFVVLAATLAVVPKVPVAGLALILGIDRFMSEARALTNIIGNGVATLVISAWEGELDRESLQRELHGGISYKIKEF
jgi:aerobic C4-dicarboxylate transport protein